jgi:hypothetical protein
VLFRIQITPSVLLLDWVRAQVVSSKKCYFSDLQAYSKQHCKMCVCVCVCVCSGFSVQCTIIYHLCWIYRHTPLKIGLLLTIEGIAFLLRQTQVVVAFSGGKNPFPMRSRCEVLSCIKKLWLMMMGNCWWDFLPWLHIWSTKRSNISSKSFVIILLSILIWNLFFQCLHVPYI